MNFRQTCTAFAAALTLALPMAAPLFAHGTEEHAAMQDHPEGVMHVHNAYARVNGTASGAVFFTIHNNTETDDRLIGVKTEIAEKSELHGHLDDNGVMKMIKLEEGIALPWAEMHSLARGGDHVMLMGLKEALKNGDSFTMTLLFEHGPEMAVDVVVDNDRKADAEEMDHAGH